MSGICILIARRGFTAALENILSLILLLFLFHIFCDGRFNRLNFGTLVVAGLCYTLLLLVFVWYLYFTSKYFLQIDFKQRFILWFSLLHVYRRDAAEFDLFGFLLSLSFLAFLLEFLFHLPLAEVFGCLIVQSMKAFVLLALPTESYLTVDFFLALLDLFLHFCLLQIQQAQTGSYRNFVLVYSFGFFI